MHFVTLETSRDDDGVNKTGERIIQVISLTGHNFLSMKMEFAEFFFSHSLFVWCFIG